MTKLRNTPRGKGRLLPIRIVRDQQEADSLAQELLALGPDVPCCFDTEWKDWDDNLTPIYNGLAFCVTLSWRTAEGDQERVYLHNHGESEGNIHALTEWFGSPLHWKVGHNVPVDAHIVSNHGIVVRNCCTDTLVMDFCVDENREGQHGLKECASDYFGLARKSFKETFGELRLKKDGTPYASGQLDVEDLVTYVRGTEPPESLNDDDHPEIERWRNLIDYAVEDATDTLMLFELHRANLSALPWLGGKTYYDFFREVECPTTEIITSMERRGMYLDASYLREMREIAILDQQKAEAEITEKLGCSINVGSSKQLGMLLYGSGAQPVFKTGSKTKLLYYINGLELPVLKRTETGKPSTSSGDMKALRKRAKEIGRTDAVEILDLVMNYNRRKTQIATYLVGWGEKVRANGRLHGRINQIGACMPAGGLVSTSRGYLPVEQVRIGDCVLTHRNRSRRVVDVGENGVRRVYRVELSNGLVLLTTGNHKYYRGSDAWTPAQSLREGDLVSVHSDPEQWKDIEGWPYQVSSWGRVRTLRTSKRARAGDCLKLQCKADGPYAYGHLKVTMRRGDTPTRGNGGIADFYVHRLVIGAFGTAASDANENEVRHLNGVSWDNSCWNLQWGTSKQNHADMASHGSGLRRYKDGSTRLTEKDVAEIRAMKPGVWTRKGYRPGPPSWLQAESKMAARFGVSREAIRDARVGKSWREHKESPPYQWQTAAVRSVTIEPDEMTYLLTVEEDHSHVTAGIITHNTSGRFSMSDPNLQNVTTGDKDTYYLRDIICAPPGHVLVVADFSQLEYRLLAHFTQDPKLLEAFRQGWDLHSLTTYNIFPTVKMEVDERFGGITTEALTWIAEEYSNERKRGKTLNFEIIYGVGANKLAEQLDVSYEEAKRMVDAWFAGYAYVKPWKERMLREARDKGFVRTLMGRYRRPNMRRFNHQCGPTCPFYDHAAQRRCGIKGEEERTIINAVIQGSAADMCKRAMKLLHDDPTLRRFNAHMNGQVHDELIIECPIEHAAACKDRVKSLMENLFSKPLRVPMPVSVGIGPSWGTAKA